MDHREWHAARLCLQLSEHPHEVRRLSYAKLHIFYLSKPSHEWKIVWYSHIYTTSCTHSWLYTYIKLVLNATAVITGLPSCRTVDQNGEHGRWVNPFCLPILLLHKLPTPHRRITPCFFKSVHFQFFVMIMTEQFFTLTALSRI
jgi:hypothetical protein